MSVCHLCVASLYATDVPFSVALHAHTLHICVLVVGNICVGVSTRVQEANVFAALPDANLIYSGEHPFWRIVPICISRSLCVFVC